MTALEQLLDAYRQTSKTQREKGTYFEELICTYFRNEATYRDLYSDVWLYSDWAKAHPKFNLSAKDTGIDLVAKTQGTDEYHAIQCKCYAEDYRLQKGDIDSFFTASGQKPFVHRIIVATTNSWSDNAEQAMLNQRIPVNKIDLHDLENSQIDWAQYRPDQAPVLKIKYDLRPHQHPALNAVKAGLEQADRGKLIMACGTGKTFTSLKIAEELAGHGKRVLFLVPSLSLLSQALTEWTQQSTTPLHSFAVCSDSDVGKKRKIDEDIVQTFTHELRYPATTEPQRLADELSKRHDGKHMSVVFSTYHSIEVISKAQRLHNLADFDLIICDEAHRTTGSKFADEDESAFVKVHDRDYIKASKRLYMTATPRIYGDSAKIKQEQGEVALFSMDDEAHYGKELYCINFSEAVQRGLLCDYKVIVLTVDEAHISKRLQKLLSDENNQLKVDDAAKIVGCWKALSKQANDNNHDDDGFGDDHDPMRRAVAFCQVIEPGNKNARTHKVSSKNIAGMFQQVVDAYQEQEHDHSTLHCEAEHIDGSMNASQKEAKIDWLKAEPAPKTCKILSNVRCLSEGVDIPALDAVLFLTPRNSQIDVVQSVGRVMRNNPHGKKERGYVILPVVIPTGMDPHAALNDNRVYKVVWEVLQALRSHDDRFDAMINKLDLIGKDTRKMEVISITDNVQKKANKGGNGKKRRTGKNQYGIGKKQSRHDADGQMTDQHGMHFEVGEIERALYAKVVKKCGNRNHWGDWASDIAKIANTHIGRITAIVSEPNNTKEIAAFTRFADELRDDLNDSITDAEVIEMLAQHLITKPVFDALFEGYSFASNNPVSVAMQQVLDLLHEHRLEKEADTLERFYASVKMRAEGIDNAEGKQKIVVELYDKFFRNAFPRMTERLGIVYTPVEVVDFIIHSVNDLLKQEFGQTLGSEGVHILDPFTGTGTFITRLLQSGLISKEQLPNKYQNEIHANEIVLLAYYIAAINIEAVYHSVVGKDESEYLPFEGICLTDTFQLYEKDDLVSELLADNSCRRTRQKNLDIRVIMGNPPYAAGQKNAGDDTESVKYEKLDQRISSTYVTRSSKAGGKRASYNSFVRAIRWATDRVGDSGIIGFVVSASFIQSVAADGMRKSLVDEFSSISIIHLRGNQRTSGEESRREGGKIFDSGSREPIAICLFVKKKNYKSLATINFYDIGDYLSRNDKLRIISEYKSVISVNTRVLVPDEHGDWLNQRDNSFEEHIVSGSKKKEEHYKVFNAYSNGVVSSRDSWVFNSSRSGLIDSSSSMICFYNSEVDRYSKYVSSNTKSIKIKDFVDYDDLKISWGGGNWQASFSRLEKQGFEINDLEVSTYRPFTKIWHYGGKNFNHSYYSMKSIFPIGAMGNLVICVTGRGANKAFSTLLCNSLPDLEMIAKGQCFPLYLYEKASNDKIDFGDSGNLFAQKYEPTDNGYTRKDGISDAGLAHFAEAYPGETISKEDLFYYIYGLLHSPEYRARYANNLSKELPRIPAVKAAADFWRYSQAGRDMAALHIDYETVTPYKAKLDTGSKPIKQLTDADYRVVKMKFAKHQVDGKNVNDKTTVIYNPGITVRDIPLEAYDYVVNGKPAIEWVMERQAVTTDKKSGIVNDANDWAIETMDDAKYPLELLLRVITVSLETMIIIKSLPKLDID